MNRTFSLLLFILSTAVVAPAAGQEAKYRAPRAENGQPDLQGVWNFNPGAPLQRPAAFVDKKFFTREEADDRQAAFQRAQAAIEKNRPVEGAPRGWFADRPRIDDLRTSLITYPENGRLPALLPGVRRIPSLEELLEALSSAEAPPPSSASGLAAPIGGKNDGYADFNMAARCLVGADVPFVPQPGGSYVQIIQGSDSVALVTDLLAGGLGTDRRIVSLDGRPPLGDTLRSWAGTSRGRWEGETLVVETGNFNGRTPSFAGAGNSREKVVTERFTRTSKGVIEYAATVVDPKTFLDRVELWFRMAHVDAHIYEGACHEGNYSLRNALSAARIEDAR
jgi:hypothetical protein